MTRTIPGTLYRATLLGKSGERTEGDEVMRCCEVHEAARSLLRRARRHRTPRTAAPPTAATAPHTPAATATATAATPPPPPAGPDVTREGSAWVLYLSTKHGDLAGGKKRQMRKKLLFLSIALSNREKNNASMKSMAKKTYSEYAQSET